MVTSGVVFYAFFGLGWLLAGLGHFGGTATGTAGTLGLIAALALVLTAHRQSSRQAGRTSVPPPSPEARRTFGRVNAAQWLLIAAIAAGCGAGGVPQLVMPLVAVVVGLHFLPLARVFADPRLVVPGLVLVGLGIAGLLARAAGASPGAVYTLVGVGSAATLWSTAVWSLAGAARGSRRDDLADPA